MGQVHVQVVLVNDREVLLARLGQLDPSQVHRYEKWASIMASATPDDLVCHGRAPRRPHRKTFELSGPSATRPEVADTVIKALLPCKTGAMVGSYALTILQCPSRLPWMRCRDWLTMCS
jgi:hypothetical protein